MFSRRATFEEKTNRLTRLLKKKRSSGAPIFDLTQSNPTLAGFEYPKGLLSFPAAESSFRYQPTSAGLPEARKAIAAYYAEKKRHADVEDIFLTASTSEAYSWLFKLLADPGDRVVVPRPSYPLFDYLAALESVDFDRYPLRYDGSWHIDLANLQRSITATTRAIVYVNPNNPTGSFLSEAEWERLAGMCNRNSLALIVDEVFSDYVIDASREECREYSPGQAERSPGNRTMQSQSDPGAVKERAATGTQISNYCRDAIYRDAIYRVPTSDTDARVQTVVGRHDCVNFVLSGFSKVLCLPQMKLGWILVQGPHQERRQACHRLEFVADTFLSVNTPVQNAAAEWLGHRHQMQSQVLDRVNRNLSFLRRHTEGSPCCVLDLEGGWYAVLQVPKTLSEEEWVLSLLEQDNVLVHPGYFFDFEQEAFLVLSLLPQPELFETSVRRLVARIKAASGPI